jgi:hypothetical protein
VDEPIAFERLDQKQLKRHSSQEYDEKRRLKKHEMMKNETLHRKLKTMSDTESR